MQLEENLLKNDPEVQEALRLLQSKGYNSTQLQNDFEELNPIPVTNQPDK